MKFKKRLLPFVRAVPDLLVFRIVAELLLWGCSALMAWLSSLLLGSAGKASISSGDFSFIFTNWQGYVLILIAFAIVLLYVAVDVNALIIFCGRLLNGEKPSLFRAIRDGVISLMSYANPRGLIVILYTTLISPLIGLGFSVSLTRSLYIPRFISSVIDSNMLFFIGLNVLRLLLTVVFIIYIFLPHGTLLDNMRMKDAGIASRKLIKAHWKSYLLEMLRFILLCLAAFIVLGLFCLVIPYLIVVIIPADDTTSLFLQTFVASFGMLVLMLLQGLMTAFLIMKITILYRSYQSNGEWQYRKAPKRKHVFVIIASAFTLVMIVAFSLFAANFYDGFFPAEISAGIVAHRAGGVEAPENTVKGIEVSSQLGADG